jgi:hypothetical protein
MKLALAVAASLLLAVTGVALAATPGLWANKRDTVLVEVSSNGKRIVELDLTCSKHRSLSRQFASGKGPRISGGRFTFSGRARVIKGGAPSGHRTLTVSGHFVSGKKLTGTASSTGCASRDFTAKPKPPQAIPFE